MYTVVEQTGGVECLSRSRVLVVPVRTVPTSGDSRSGREDSQVANRTGWVSVQTPLGSLPGVPGVEALEETSVSRG